jgi:hypothetical protein
MRTGEGWIPAFAGLTLKVGMTDESVRDLKKTLSFEERFLPNWSGLIAFP